MNKTKTVLVITFCLVCIACSNNNNKYFDEVFDSLVSTENYMRDSGYVTASSIRANELVKFRIMADHNISRIEAKTLVEEFISHFENQLTELEKYYKDYELTFDLKSKEDGTILFNGKRARGEKDIWWQF